MSSEETTPPEAPTPNTVSIRVVSSNGDEMFFKIKKTTKLSKLFDAYTSRKDLKPDSIKFLFDGNRLSGDQTPESLDMEDNDVIDAMLTQTGGLFIKLNKL